MVVLAARLALVLGLGAAAQAAMDPSSPASLFALRALHWAVTIVSLAYPILFPAAYDVAFVTLWVVVFATWAACDNACVLSLVEARHPSANDDPAMRLLPVPWPAFAVLLLVVAARTPSVRWCPEKTALLGALAAYIGVHERIHRSEVRRHAATKAPAPSR